MTVQLPFDQAVPLEMPAQLRSLQADGVIHKVRTRVGHDAWLVTGYHEVRRLLDDERLGRSHPDPGNAARLGESALFGGPLGDFDTEKVGRCCSRTSPPNACGRCDHASKL